MSTEALQALIDREVYGNTGASLLGPGYGTPSLPPGGMPEPSVGAQSYAEATPRAPQPGLGYWDQEDIGVFIDKQTDGWSGPSLDGFQGVSYAGDPGYGIMNDNIDHPSTVGLGGFTIPSDEVGVGRAPGWRFAHYPHVIQQNLRRECYVDQGMFGDGRPRDPRDSVYYDQRQAVRSPAWVQALENQGMDPAYRYQPVGSAMIDQPAGVSLSQVMSQLGVVGWGVQ